MNNNNAGDVDVPIDKKWAVLRHASSLWRNWKCTLNTDYVQPRRLTNPESMRIRPKRFHKIIKRKEWNEFVDLVTSPRFMKRSAEQKAKKAMQKYAPITGRGGMTGVFDKLVLEGVLDPQRSDYGFVNPMAIADFKHCAPVQERAIKLANFLSNRYTHDKLYLVPYLHEKHWMLILINPSANTAQWCNSFGGSPRPQAIELTERALIEFHHRRGNEWDRNSLTWTVVDVPNQPGLTECALCVMRYMSLIISSGKRIFSDKLENRAVYKREHFSALKEEWAEFFMSRILPMYQVRHK
ncbi:hypothetical protein ACFE04_030442 [Oxalis oulophora]